MEADSTTNLPRSSSPKRSGSSIEDEGRPVQVVEVDGDTGTFQLKIDELRAILLQDKVKDKPVAVVSIAGDFRKGKSFLLNFFVRYLQKKSAWLEDKNEPLKGFSWRGGHKRETTGILMWSKPFITRRKDGREVAVLLMDTQGTFDNKSTIRDSATVFAISTMTSSIQIFNILHNMQEDNLQVLDVFIEYGKIAQESIEAKPFQKLMFLIRDWSYPYEYKYGIDGGRELLEEQLKVTPEQRPQLQRVRKNINSCFADIGCFLLPHPGPKVATNPNFDGRVSDIEPEFVENMEQLVYQLLAPENIVVKQVGGRDLTGAQLLEYFVVYTDKFNGETIPEPKTMLEATAEANNLGALQGAKELYESKMREICGGTKAYVNPGILEKKHKAFRQEALDFFDSAPKLGGEEFSTAYLQRLKDEIDTANEHFRSQNDSKNMLHALGSTVVLLIWSVTCFLLSKGFEFLFEPFSNLFYIFATSSFAGAVAYMGSKFTGNFPETIAVVDAIVAQIQSFGQQIAFHLFYNNMEERIGSLLTSDTGSSDST